MSKNVPEVRFEGFSGDWERKKLGESNGKILMVTKLLKINHGIGR